MSDRPLIIIHGWSDNSHSFRKLAQLLQSKLNRKTKFINLADYVTMDDEVNFDDIIAAMTHAWYREKLPLTPYSTDVIVHSTGGLIIRDWLARHFTPQTAPIKHLLMLAPANFGSQLAHKGQSFYGRILKGFSSPKLFQIGIKILQGLELASPYTWELAMQDRFGKKDFYGAKKILCTVLVGNAGFTGISAAANEEGSDGTVRISTANMNCAYLDADFSTDPLKPTFTMKKSSGEIGFGVLDKENHITIIAREGGPKNPRTFDAIIDALTVSDENFKAWCKTLNEGTARVMQAGIIDSNTHGFQNSVFFVHDQFGNHIKDYFLEFYLNRKKQNWFAEVFHQDVIKRVHTFGGDNSYRSVYIDCTKLSEQLSKPWENMNLSLTALPEFRVNKNVGYRTFTEKDIGAILLTKEQVKETFLPNRTLLVRLTLRREQSPELFTIRKF